MPLQKKGYLATDISRRLCVIATKYLFGGGYLKRRNFNKEILIILF